MFQKLFFESHMLTGTDIVIYIYLILIGEGILNQTLPCFHIYSYIPIKALQAYQS